MEGNPSGCRDRRKRGPVLRRDGNGRRPSVLGSFAERPAGGDAAGPKAFEKLRCAGAAENGLGGTAFLSDYSENRRRNSPCAVCPDVRMTERREVGEHPGCRFVSEELA